MAKIKISGNFDGGNPKDQNSIIQTAPDTFTIYPYSEDNDPNYKFRLDVQANNDVRETKRLHLFIEWKEPQFNHLRNYIYAKHEEEVDWTLYPMSVEDTGTWGDIDVEPGITHLCMHPKYNYQDYINFINKIPSNGIIKKELIGKTPEGRDLWLLKISNENPVPKKKILFVSRIHPYETSGSFCVEGIVDYFLSKGSELLCDVFRDVAIYLLPMANPDGVYHGLCKLTAPDGIDLSKQVDTSDSNSTLLVKCIDEVRPDVYCEFHNWMFQELDGISFLNWLQTKRFIRNLHSKKLFNKNWKIHLRKIFFSISPHGFKKYCRDKFGSICLCLEYPWRNRNIEDMKKMGIDSLMALTKI